jgi:hypothetical protein
MNKHDRQRIQREYDKLNHLVDEALENGTPISEAYALMKQSKKVQVLMFEFGNKDKESGLK